MREERRKGKRLLGQARAGAALKAEQAGTEWASDELGRGLARASWASEWAEAGKEAGTEERLGQRRGRRKSGPKGKTWALGPK